MMPHDPPLELIAKLSVIWCWIRGGYKWFKPGKCTQCGRFELVFKSTSDTPNWCEWCWLESK